MSFPFGRLSWESAETREDVRKTRYRLKVKEPFKWVSDRSQIAEVTVPKDFETDGGSVPRLFWRLLGGPGGPLRDAYVVHDMLYSQAGLTRRTREECDKVLREIILELGAERWKAWLVYRGVRAGGWIAWRGHMKRNTEKPA